MTVNANNSNLSIERLDASDDKRITNFNSTAKKGDNNNQYQKLQEDV